MYSANTQAYELSTKPINFYVDAQPDPLPWLFHRIFNPGINPEIPELQNPSPEIPGLRSGPEVWKH